MVRRHAFHQMPIGERRFRVEGMHQHSPSLGGLTRRSLLLRSLGLGSSALLLGACSGLQLPAAPRVSRLPTVATGPRSGGVLRISQPTDIAPHLVPHTVSPQTLQIDPLVYDTLVAYDTQLQPQPRLATSWQWSSDYRQIRLQLRPGVKFHTGRAFTSAEAKFNLESLRDPSLGSQWMNYAKRSAMAAP